MRRMLSDPAFAASVNDWRARLAPLHDEVEEQLPAPHIWPLIEARLGHSAAEAVILTRLRRWRVLAVASTAIAATLGAFMILQPAQAPVVTSSPVMVAQIASDHAGPLMLARYDTSTRRFSIAPAVMQTAGHSPELWLIPGDGKPRSLGTFDPSSPTVLTVPEAMTQFIDADTVIAVSIEPVGGSPTGQPSGPVVAKGKMQMI
ncbi:anti-sigma factor [Sphingobium boeckii]|uniref:Anti-sigma-K factor RskA n=1 Tax=Sphingobium boeckii TaxID=1082345 RepID=A0A7W9EH84_9SPHN|nr:anti-sigma factor [Sphingobium boeckii]MBB5687845.1 anti-sigma-K factor RskA [Sphingobium boeckii]